MELELIRTYFPNGTNGDIFHNGERVCSSIELPWRQNKQRISCIPEGKYELVKRYTQRYGHHLLLLDVPGRSFILIHSANDAQKEMKGCIAPVSACTGEGKGIRSRLAMKKFFAIIYPEMEKANNVFLNIKSKVHE